MENEYHQKNFEYLRLEMLYQERNRIDYSLGLEILDYIDYIQINMIDILFLIPKFLRVKFHLNRSK